MLNNTILAGQGLTKEVCSEMHSYGTLLNISVDIYFRGIIIVRGTISVNESPTGC